MSRSIPSAKFRSTPVLAAFASGCLLCAASLPFLGCRVTDAPIWTESKTKSTAGCDIQELRDLQYASALKLQPFRHKLDLVLPVGKKDYPVVILVHGGAWILGDNRCCGLYTSVGQFLASQGIGVVLPNYRLSPMVKHPDHVKDLAKVMAWTRDNMGQFGADPADAIEGNRGKRPVPFGRQSQETGGLGRLPRVRPPPPPPGRGKRRGRAGGAAAGGDGAFG